MQIPPKVLALFRIKLTWAANRMNLFGGDERTVVYSPVSHNPYWIMVVPEGTAPERLPTLGFQLLSVGSFLTVPRAAAR